MKRVGRQDGSRWRCNESHVVVEMAVQPRLQMEISVMLPWPGIISRLPFSLENVAGGGKEV
jgi:hypothetical protein